METPSVRIRARYSHDNACDDIDAALAALASRKVPEIDGYLLSPVSSIPSRVADILQLGTRRSIDLAESTIRETNREQLNSSCILTRAVLETSCLMLYVSLQVRRVVQDPTKAGFDKLNKFMTNTLVGSGRKAKTFYFKGGVCRHEHLDHYGEARQRAQDAVSGILRGTLGARAPERARHGANVRRNT